MRKKPNPAMPTGKDIWAKLIAWHTEERRSSIKSTFELGDLIMMAIINTKLVEYDVIHRIQKELGELALGETTYNRACRLVRVFTPTQRKILIENAVSARKSETLASKLYDGKKRINIIQNIKTGKSKAPWSSIETRSGNQAANAKGHTSTEDEAHGINRANHNQWDLSTIYKNGIIDDDKLDIWLQSIVSVLAKNGISPECIEQSVKRALTRVRKLAG